MKTIVALAIVLASFVGGNRIFAQTGKNLFTITVYESIDKGYNKIVVHEADKVVEEVALSALYYKDLAAHQSEINRVLQKYCDTGYRIVSETRGSFSVLMFAAGGSTQTLVMVTGYRLEFKN